ncbi:acyclic terpene utilization AtuA family protein [Anaeroselena agilis]|uniref:Acyclic terpene utilization AtuA family protein n=1 Tax=Anaeroselena agilis TaxID=3063788 RepID=A0ABU3P1F8_9FIRM|nr:acyclic terpene utilization AtuA family protein [Selenomonadales bacterium 4137-cl]
MKKIRLGAGAGYSGDRIEPAVELAEKGNIQYLCFECLAERTIAIAQQAKMKDPSAGYDALLAARMEAVLPVCSQKGIKIITNMGAANPEAGARKIKEVAGKLGVKGLKIAAVSGDDVLEAIRGQEYTIEETGGKLSAIKDKLVSANAYLGAGPIIEALKGGADIVITGRVADPALFIAPLAYEFGWSLDDWNLMGQATVIGHLMECAGQITGGYFADPGYKDVPGIGHLGFPIAEVSEDGAVVITKVPEAGGMVALATCKEQLLYEIHNPAAYFTPDVVADFTGVQMAEIAKDQVKVTGGKGAPKTDLLKVSIGYVDSYIGEGQISYAGPGAVERGRLALDIVKERLGLMGVKTQECRFDLIGVNALHAEKLSAGHEPYEVRARVAGRTENLQEAVRIGNEVETLYTNGPAGGAGAWKSAREVVAMVSILIPRSLVNYSVKYEVV